MRAVILSPHPDDVEIAASGLLVVEKPTVLIAANCGRERRYEAEAAADEFGVEVEFLNLGMDGTIHQSARAQAEVDEAVAGADVVYTPHPVDWHQDHRAVAHLGVASVRHSTALVWLYGAASCYERSDPTIVLPLIERETAERAIRHHRSQRLYAAPMETRLWEVSHA
jgi:LmbE family N-acetylglucosaminyl deacetylase